MYSYSTFFWSPSFRPIFYFLLIVDLILKGISLWRSARKGQQVWFVALLIVNSMGILPLIYLLLENRPESSEPKKVLLKKKSKKK